ncbi:MAG TPA: amidohydrolase family protein, partial [Pyrinomonadaceae bacterium]|nr:amidohydrolase family protein [Pyrinomonadaceae bacterium]
HGRAPFGKFVAAGIAVGVGSDSVASNNTCDMLEEARFATLLGRSDRWVSATDALEALTLGGASCFELENEIGQLREGFKADLIAVSLSGVHQIPNYDPVATLIFASSGRDVILTVVAGREVFREGSIAGVDEERLRLRMREITEKLEHR